MTSLKGKLLLILNLVQPNLATSHPEPDRARSVSTAEREPTTAPEPTAAERGGLRRIAPLFAAPTPLITMYKI